MPEITAIVHHPDGDYEKPYAALTRIERLVVEGLAYFERDPIAGLLIVDGPKPKEPYDRHIPAHGGWPSQEVE